MGETAQTWWLYLLRMSNGALYCGITTDVQRRYLEHSSGGSKSAKCLRNKGELEIVFAHKLNSKREALQLEYRIKQWPKAKKERLVAGLIDPKEWASA